MNLGSLSLQFLDLSSSPLDAPDPDLRSADDILSSIRTLTGMSDITDRDDQFSIDHRNCCIGTGLICSANYIAASLDGIELEAVASEAPPQKSRQLSHLSSLVKMSGITSDPSPYEIMLRWTAIPIGNELWRDITIRSQATSDPRFAWCPRVKCNYCPAFNYSLFQHLNVDSHIRKALEWHSTNFLHCERVRRRRREIRRRSRLEAALAT